MRFSEEFFQKFKFTDSQIRDYWNSAKDSLRIAVKIDIPEVVFKFSYDALIKLGITLIAKKGFKMRSNAGHHIKILEVMSVILGDRDVEVIGNIMRRQRNADLYHGGFRITEKQSKEYLLFVKGVFNRSKTSITVVNLIK